MVGEGVDQNGGVLAGFHHFVQVQYGSGLHRARHGAVDPAGAVGVKEVASHEVAGSEVLVAGNGYQRDANLTFAHFLRALAADRGDGPAEFPRHVLDEARLAAPGGAFQQDRDVLLVSGLE